MDPRAIVLIFLTSCTLLVFTAELLCRSLGLGNSVYLQPDSKLGSRLIPGRKVRWNFEGFSNDVISSAGFRDIEHSLQKPADVKRILILSDSVAEGLQVPLGKTLSRRLQAMFDRSGRGVEVINASCSNYSVGQYLLMYCLIGDAYEPDEVVVLYSYGDSIENIRDARDLTAQGRPYFYMDGNVLRIDESLVPNKYLCAVCKLLLNESSLFCFLVHQDYILNLQDLPYRERRANLLKSLRFLTCPEVKYPSQNRRLVRDAVFCLMNKIVTQKGVRLNVFTLPTRGINFCKVDYDEVKSLGAREGFCVVNLEDCFKTQGNKAFLEYHLSELGHQLIAKRMFQHFCLK